MQSLLGRCATLYNPTQIHSVLNSLADECCGMLARLVVYVGALALLAIVGIHLWDQLPAGEAAEASAKAAWSPATRSHPAFAVSQFDLAGKTETYQILRRRGGGRKDILRWPPRTESKAKSRSPSSRSIAAAANPANPGRWLTSPPESTPAARASWRRLESSTAKIGDRRGKPQAAWHFLTGLAEAASQDAGFHASFSYSDALL
jgi:hypothetical protein